MGEIRTGQPNKQKRPMLEQKDFGIAVELPKSLCAGCAVNNQHTHDGQIKNDPPDLAVTFKMCTNPVAKKHVF